MEVSTQYDSSPGRWEGCNSQLEGTRFRQGRQSCLKHPDVSHPTRVVANVLYSIMLNITNLYQYI